MRILRIKKLAPLVLTAFLTLTTAWSQDSKPEYPFLDPSLSYSERVEDLLSRMTAEEKASQLLYNAPAVDRLGIPAYNWWNECLHGVARNGLATVFPQAIAMASSFDTSLVTEVATVISDEARAKYHYAINTDKRNIYQGLTFWTPNINIFRDPRWGRGMETYGEDPYLSGSIAVNFINALQGQHPDYLKLVATAKHFAVHSGPESSRHSFDAVISGEDLYNTYLPHFERVVRESNVESMMCAYNRLNGEPACGSSFLLNTTLRDKWGFEGYVVSDCWGLVDFFNGHGFSDGPVDAAAAAISAGTDLNCGVVYTNIVAALDSGLVSMAEIDQALERLFMARFRLGMFDLQTEVPFSNLPYSIVDSKEHRAIALKAARSSMVLLKNEDQLLPLSKDLKTIAVIGPHALEEEAMLGNYNGTPSHVISPYSGIKKKLNPEARVLYARGCDIAQGLPYLEVIPEQYLFTDSTLAQNGLLAKYYSNTELEGNPVGHSHHKKIDFNWWDKAPMAELPDDQFSVCWTGFLVPKVSGEYYLGANGSYEFRIFLSDSMLTNHTSEHHQGSHTVKVRLEAGEKYKIRIEYINHERLAAIKLVWAMPHTDLEEEALAIAEQSDVIVLCMGLSPRLEGEEMDVHVDGFMGGDRTSLGLPESQLRLMRKLKSLNKPMVLVLFNGSAVAINWEKENIPAILEAWYPGQAAGTAIADILFGDYNPAGRLPVTFYKSVDDLPAFEDYNMTNRTYRYFEGEALYEFGYGLSFTNFEYKKAKLSANKISTSGSCTLQAEIHNSGNYDGEEVVQLYIRKKDSKFQGPIKELKAFQRVTIPQGSSKEVLFEIQAAEMVHYDKDGNKIIESGTWELMLGSSSEQIHIVKEIIITN